MCGLTVATLIVADGLSIQETVAGCLKPAVATLQPAASKM